MLQVLVTDEPPLLQTLDIDAESIWVAGKAYATRIFTNQITAAAASIDATLNGVSTSIAISTISFSLNLAENLGSFCNDPTDGCCADGNFDAGIVVSADSTTVYAANACRTGLVSALYLFRDEGCIPQVLSVYIF